MRSRGTPASSNIAVATLALVVAIVSLVGLAWSSRSEPVSSDGFVELDSARRDATSPDDIAPDATPADDAPLDDAPVVGSNDDDTGPATADGTQPSDEPATSADTESPTPETNCSSPSVADPAAVSGHAVVISELHYHPEFGGPSAEFVELYNPSPADVDLGGWSIGGIGQCFEPGSTLPAGSTLVITAADHGGELDNGGETVTLIDSSGVTVDSVTYGDRDAWPALADGNGDSLHRIDAGTAGDRPGNWIAAAPDPGRATQYRYGPMAEWSDVDHTNEPGPSEPIEISAIVSGVDAVRPEVAYRIGFDAEVVAPMTLDADGRATATIPGQDAGTLVRYRLIAHTPDGGAGTWPRQGDGATYTGTVVRDPVDSDLVRFQWFMTDVDHRRAFDDVSYTSTTRYPAVFAVDGEVFDSATIRVKGQSSRTFPKPKWTVELPAGHRLRIEGVIDQPVDEFDLHAAYNDKSAIREILSHEAFAAAGLPMTDAFPVRLERNGEFAGLYTYIERSDGQWRDRVGLGSGAVYEIGNRAPAFLSGDEAELDRDQFRLRYDREGDDWDDDDELRSFLTELASVSGDDVDPAVRRQWIVDHVDVPSVLNTLAVSALVQHWDFRTKNYRLAFVDDRWTVIPFDLELTWGRTLEPACEPYCEAVSVTGPFVNDTTPLFRPFSTDPVLADLLRRRIDTLRDEVLDPEQVGERVDELIDSVAADGRRDRDTWGTYGEEQSIDDAAAQLIADFVTPQWERLTGDDAPFGLTEVPPNDVDALRWDDEGDLHRLTNIGDTTVDASGLDVPGGTTTVDGGVVLPPGASVTLDDGRIAEWTSIAPT